jgi:hypothetical protein
MAVVWKVIKPKRLKEDAFRLFMLNALRKFNTTMKKEYAKTTRTWTHKVTFEGLVSLQGSKFTSMVDTSDVIFGYVDKGTGQAAGHGGLYPIAPHPPKKALRWNSKFSAKTVPGVVGSLPGYSGGDPVYAKKVMHPGIRPRGFTKNIEKVFQGKFTKACEEAMSQFAKGCGHYAGRK